MVEHADEPLYEVFEWCRRDNTPGYRFMQQALQYDSVDPISSIAMRIREKPQTASKFLTYRTELNSALTVHKVYQTKEWIPDYKRQAFTRLRLMSHNLKVETGRRGGIPVELRVCSCSENVVQTEAHVLLACPLTRDCRTKYDTLNYESINALLDTDENVGSLCSYIYEVLKIYN